MKAIRFLLPALPWVPVASAVLAAKYRYALAFHPTAIVAPISGRPTSDFSAVEPTLHHVAAFLAWEVLVTGAIVPLIVCALLLMLPARWRLPASTVLASVALVAFYLQFKALTIAGAFLPVDSFLKVSRFAAQQPEIAAAYVGGRGTSKFAFVMFGILLVGGIAELARRRWSVFAFELERRTARHFGIAVLALVALATGIAVRPPTWRVSLFGAALAAYLKQPREHTVAIENPQTLPTHRLDSLFRTSTNTPRESPTIFGESRGNDVILIVLETVPSRCYDVTDSVAFPMSARLSSSAYVGMRHYTTYPYTSMALYSMFTSQYVTRASKDLFDRHASAVLPALSSHLAAAGYATALFSAYRPAFEDDHGMFRRFGIEQFVYGSSHETENVAVDERLFSAMLDSIGRWSRDKRRYFATFLPQFSHGPWRNTAAQGDQADLIARCRALAKRYDGWIGKLTEVLAQVNRLQSTLIVLVGDHGVRNRVEDPTFVPGLLDDYSFRVPLLVYVPALNGQQVRITEHTSHVDIAPTLLDLLGVERNRTFEQGVPLWSTSLGVRTVFLFGSWAVGADGFHMQGRYSMRNLLDQTTFESDTLHFTPLDRLPVDSPRHRYVVDILNAMYTLQLVWTARWCCESEANGVGHNPLRQP